MNLDFKGFINLQEHEESIIQDFGLVRDRCKHRPPGHVTSTNYYLYPLYFKMRDSQTHRLLVQSHRRRCVKHAVNTSL
jgi:hypothetical protein